MSWDIDINAASKSLYSPNILRHLQTFWFRPQFDFVSSINIKMNDIGAAIFEYREHQKLFFFWTQIRTVLLLGPAFQKPKVGLYGKTGDETLPAVLQNPSFKNKDIIF